ncbi:hypothetical protein ACIBAH_32880 [Streptomyces sp. NPDC051445]|uniref:hypothetical protein n=1 Tax=unclassified Streptomyces TaxID=2593676 RepID=UPI0037A111A0
MRQRVVSGVGCSAGVAVGGHDTHWTRSDHLAAPVIAKIGDLPFIGGLEQSELAL